MLHLVAALGRAHAGQYAHFAFFEKKSHRGDMSLVPGRFTNEHLVAFNAKHRQQGVAAACKFLATQPLDTVNMCVKLGTAQVTESSCAGDFRNVLNQPLLGGVDDKGYRVMAMSLLHEVYASDSVRYCQCSANPPPFVDLYNVSRTCVANTGMRACVHVTYNYFSMSACIK